MKTLREMTTICSHVSSAAASIPSPVMDPPLATGTFAAMPSDADADTPAAPAAAPAGAGAPFRDWGFAAPVSDPVPAAYALLATLAPVPAPVPAAEALFAPAVGQTPVSAADTHGAPAPVPAPVPAPNALASDPAPAPAADTLVATPAESSGFPSLMSIL